MFSLLGNPTRSDPARPISDIVVNIKGQAGGLGEGDDRQMHIVGCVVGERLQHAEIGRTQISDDFGLILR